MRNINVSINDKVYRDARGGCVQHDISVSKVVQRFLEDLPLLKQSHRFPLPGAKPQIPREFRGAPRKRVTMPEYGGKEYGGKESFGTP